ncbi:MAG: peptide ABC transporter substrate-binding protein [Candidatus Marinimicrobia bacterium]|nr:peptide ABC transporter substrate-binding protein [Candidatus Neomarinimicrobiota bacterium]
MSHIKSMPAIILCALCALPAALLYQPALSTEDLMVFHRGNVAEPGSLDPHQSGGTWENNIIGELLMGLTTDDIAGQPIPGAAESWTISADGLIWTFKLRHGSVWSDGIPVKASDFVFGIRRLLDPKTAARYAFIAYVIKNAAAVNSGEMTKENLGVRAIDDNTLEIILEEPTPFFPGLLTHYTTFPIPEHVVQKYGDDWVKPGNMVSNGPYILKSWAANDHVKVVKNKLFYDAAKVAIDEVYFYPTDDVSSALNRFRAGELDANIGSLGFPVSQTSWLQENLPGQAHITPQLATSYIVFNIRTRPFSDKGLRRAFSMCIDRETLTEKVSRDGRLPAYAFVPPGTANYEATAQLDFAGWSMEERQAEALRLLEEAGYNEKNPLIFEYLYMANLDGRRSAVVLAAMLKKCNIIARLIANEARVHYDMVQGGNFSAALAGWSADYDDPHTFLNLLDSRAGAYNYGAYHNPKYDQLMDQAATTLDAVERAQLLTNAEQMSLDDSAVAPLSYPTSKMLIAPHVKGYVPNANMYHRNRWMWLEK